MWWLLFIGTACAQPPPLAHRGAPPLVLHEAPTAQPAPSQPAQSYLQPTALPPPTERPFSTDNPFHPQPSYQATYYPTEHVSLERIGYFLIAGIAYLGLFALAVASLFMWWQHRKLKAERAAEIAFMKRHISGLPFTARFEHQWVIAPTGGGKTSLLQEQILADLDRVERGECSIIVIDSQNVMIPKIANLKVFAPDGPLFNKLRLIEPDPEHPPALNVLDMGVDLENASDREKLRMQARVIENVRMCLAQLADQQIDLLNYMVELALVIPDANIQTLVEMLKPGGIEQYQAYLRLTDQTVQDFFLTVFGMNAKGDSNKPTKDAMFRRIMGMLRNPTFRRMFINPYTTFSMEREIAEPKVILINTDKDFLRDDACQLFGRYFIAQLLQVSESRNEHSLPVFCYIDECQDYIANDENIAKMIDKLRKRNIGLIFANQRIKNIESANVLDALSNVAIRYAARNETDAGYLAPILRCTPDDLLHKPQGSFMCFVRGVTKQALTVTTTEHALEKLPTMTSLEYANVKEEMWFRYGGKAAWDELSEVEIVPDDKAEIIPPQSTEPTYDEADASPDR